MKPTFARIGALAILAVTLGVAPDAPPGGLSITVTPGKIDVTVRAGEIANIPVTVRNDAILPTHVVLTSSNFMVADDGTYHYDIPAGASSLTTWIAVRPREFDLAPNSFQQVQVSLLVPDRGMSGEYAGALLVGTRAPRDRGSMAFSARFAAKVYAVINGTGRKDGRVERVSAGIDESGNERYHIAFHNSGNTHVYLNGRIEVRRDGTAIQTLPLPKNIIVERGGDRNIDVSGPRLAPAGYEIIAVVDYGGDQRTGGKIHLDAR
jgi:hypothetical protein